MADEMNVLVINYDGRTQVAQSVSRTEKPRQSRRTTGSKTCIIAPVRREGKLVLAIPAVGPRARSTAAGCSCLIPDRRIVLLASSGSELPSWIVKVSMASSNRAAGWPSVRISGL